MDGIELMATAMHAAQVRLDVSASNLANVSSDGFRRRVARATLTERGLLATSTLDPGHGPLRRTGRALDLAAVDGSLAVREPAGGIARITSGSFVRDAAGRLLDPAGRALLGRRGPVSAPDPGAEIDSRGFVRDGAGRVTDRLALSPGAGVRSGFLEAPNVDAVGEMVAVLDAQRAFETAQKTLSALDEERQREAGDVARVKA